MVKVQKKKVKQHRSGNSVLPRHVTDPLLFGPTEGTFVDNSKKQKVYVHLVPAPWSRVILISLVYALAVAFVKIAWFHFVGRPQWYAVSPESAVEADFERSSQESTTEQLRALRRLAR